MMSSLRRLTAALVATTTFISLSMTDARAAATSLISLQTGHTMVLHASGITKVAVGDGSVAGAVPIGTSQVAINGKAPGHTTILIWANGARQSYELTVTQSDLDDLAQMLRSSITDPNVTVMSFDHSIVVRGAVIDGAHLQQINDVVDRFNPIAKQQKAVLVNAVTILQPLGSLQKAISSLPGARDVRIDLDGKGNVIVSGTAQDAVTAQAILDRARGLAGPYLSSDGQLIDRINSVTTSQVDIKVYVLEVDRTALSNLGLQLQSANFTNNNGTIQYQLGNPSFPVVENPVGPGKALNTGPFFRSVTLAPTLNLLMQEGHARMLSSPDLVTTPGNNATFLVGGEIPIVYSTGFGQVSIQYKNYGVMLDVTPTILGDGSVQTKIAPEVSSLDFQNSVTLSGYQIPALKTSKLSTQLITRPGESIIMGGMLQRVQQKYIDKIPLLADIPVLGQLFRSTRYQNDQTDVVFVMTPEIITR